MAASKHSSTSSRTDTSTDAPQAQGDAATAGMQQMLETWMNAWRSFSDPAQRADGQTPGAAWPGANFGANFGAIPGAGLGLGAGPVPGTNGVPFPIPQLPQMPGFAS
ncbi:MAG TPA: class I poly(R)-hydroxyalkanoic acid synthase, partial [Paraburkholderia sp.]|nr:class I poly(R)-hydroxyalkanoic acid synthase [Paraburkholderia sp.]